jgi:hypothetical protein
MAQVRPNKADMNFFIPFFSLYGVSGFPTLKSMLLF